MRSRSVLLPIVTAALLANSSAAQRPSLLQRSQLPDGSWPVERFGGNAEATLQVNALSLLVYLGAGNTRSTGPFRQQVEGGARWLASQQDEKGRLSLRADPEWLLDHAIASFALCEDLRLHKKPPEPEHAALPAAAALAAQLGLARPAPSIEMRLWSEMCVHSLQEAAGAFPADGDGARHAEPLQAAAAALAKTLARLAPLAACTPRERAAARLRAAHAGHFWPESEDLPPEWPVELLEDPLASFYVATACFCRGGKGWQRAQDILGRQVVRTQERQRRIDEDGEDLFGTWAPAGAFGKQSGRLGTTAGATLLLEIYYRYIHLAILGKAS